MYKCNNSKFSWVTALLLLVLCVAGCVRTGIRVVPVPSPYVLTLSPGDITEIMRIAGFTDAQIGDLGTEVWEGLARSGAVQIQIRGRVEVTFNVNSKNEIFVTSMSRGFHVYNTQTGWAVGSKTQQPSKPQDQESSPREQEPDTREQGSEISDN